MSAEPSVRTFQMAGERRVARIQPPESAIKRGQVFEDGARAEVARKSRAGAVP